MVCGVTNNISQKKDRYNLPQFVIQIEEWGLKQFCHQYSIIHSYCHQMYLVLCSGEAHLILTNIKFRIVDTNEDIANDPEWS